MHAVDRVREDDFEPEPTAMDGPGVRIVFEYTEHGAQSIVGPFADKR